MVNDFRGRPLPEPATLAGYAALMGRYDLRVPLPMRLAATSARHNPTSTPEWLLLTPRHQPAPTLGGNLQFALKYEGLDLIVLSALFRAVGAPELEALIRATPTGSFARRVWFLYEWLTGINLDLEDCGKVRYVPIVHEGQQFALPQSTKSPRHKILNNLPGTPAFCPMVKRTGALAQATESDLKGRAQQVIGRTRPDIISRAVAFLLLDDSRSSFSIEGEQPSSARLARWGEAIGQTGKRSLDVGEFERLQKIVIADQRFVDHGLRREGGFVGVQDRVTSEPVPEHVSARWQDLQVLVAGLAGYCERALSTGLDPVIAAAAAAFGFVYIHPFEDGNGRIHRWLIHHILAAGQFTPPSLVFPVSTVILERLSEYRAVLTSWSTSMLPFIEWRRTPHNNVEVLNETADFYRYFDATPHAEFLYRCVEQTIEKNLPQEVRFLESYERFSAGVQQIVDMSARWVDLLRRFLEQNGGQLSKRARLKEFAALSDDEVFAIEEIYADTFGV